MALEAVDIVRAPAGAKIAAIVTVRPAVLHLARRRGAAVGRGCILVAGVSDTNKELVRRYYEGVVNEHRLDELASFIHPDYVDHNAEDIERGPSVVRAHLEGLRSTFPDLRVRIEQMIAEDDLVVTRVTARGTHTGVWQEIKPTGAEIRLYGINIDRFEEGLIAEHWGEADTVGMLQQMGVDPFGAGSTD